VACAWTRKAWCWCALNPKRTRPLPAFAGEGWGGGSQRNLRHLTPGNPSTTRLNAPAHSKYPSAPPQYHHRPRPRHRGAIAPALNGGTTTSSPPATNSTGIAPPPTPPAPAPASRRCAPAPPPCPNPRLTRRSAGTAGAARDRAPPGPRRRRMNAARDQLRPAWSAAGSPRLQHPALRLPHLRVIQRPGRRCQHQRAHPPAPSSAYSRRSSRPWIGDQRHIAQVQPIH
jgi:hypothetical protein